MLHFGLNMPFYYMALYGSIMIAAVLVLRGLFKGKLPAFVFPILWAVVLFRLLVPFSFSSPLSMPVPSGIFLSDPWPEGLFFNESENNVIEDQDSALPGNPQREIPETASELLIFSVVEEQPMTNILGRASTWNTVSAQTLFHAGRKILPWLYFLGIPAVAGILIRQKYRCGLKLRDSLFMEHNEAVNSILRDMDMGHVLVFTNDAIASPLVSGLFNPRIYLPTRMDFRNTVLLHHILAHETMHIKHRDNWVKAVMLAALCLNWYNPLVWIMSKCLASDLESACDAGVLSKCDEEGRKDYAYSLLAMAVNGGRSSLMYSAFSKTEVERRVKNVIHYRRATGFAVLFSVLFVTGSAVVFATGGQAPFSSYLTKYCVSSNSRWGVRVETTRSLTLGDNAQKRAEDTLFSVLRADTTGDPDILEAEILGALSKEFGVEKKAFHVMLSLCLSEEELEAEYKAWDLTRAENGSWLYQGEQIRTYQDKMLGSYQSLNKGSVDISVERDRCGSIISIAAWREGDEEYDERTRGMEENSRSSYGITEEITEDVFTEQR